MAGVSSTTLVSSIQSEILREEHNLKGVDENLKRLTGRDFNEIRNERRIRLAASPHEEGPLTKRRYPGGVFARLGAPVLEGNKETPLGRKVQEIPDEVGEPPKKRPAVASAVSRPVFDGKSRTEAAAELTKDRESRDRNRRIFGSLLGTLQRFRTEEAKQKDKGEQRAKIEKKLEEKGRAEKEELRKERLLLITQRRERQARIRRLGMKMTRVKEHEAWEEYQRQLKGFIRTKAKPPVFWIPKTLTPRASQLVSTTEETIERELEEQRLRLKEELDEALGERLAVEEEDNGEDEELKKDKAKEEKRSVHEMKRAPLPFSNGSDAFDFEAEEGEINEEGELWLPGKARQRAERVVVQVDRAFKETTRRVEVVTVEKPSGVRGQKRKVLEGNESEKENRGKVSEGEMAMKGGESVRVTKGKDVGVDKSLKEKRKHKEKKHKKEKKRKSDEDGADEIVEIVVVEQVVVEDVTVESERKRKDEPRERGEKRKKEQRLEGRHKEEVNQEKERKRSERQRERIPQEKERKRESKDRGKEKAAKNKAIPGQRTAVECAEEEDEEKNEPEEIWSEDLSHISLPLDPEPATVTEVVVQHVPVQEEGNGSIDIGEMRLEPMLIPISQIKKDTTEWEAVPFPLPIQIKKENDKSPPKQEDPTKKAGVKEKRSSGDSSGCESEEEESSDSDESSSNSSDEEEKSRKMKGGKDKEMGSSSSSSEESSSSSSSGEDDSSSSESGSSSDEEKKRPAESRSKKRHDTSHRGERTASKREEKPSGKEEVATGKGKEVVTGKGKEVVTGKGKEVATGKGKEVATEKGEVANGKSRSSGEKQRDKMNRR